MSHIETATHAVHVSGSLRELLKIMKFPEIPEGANYIAFFEDGEACFLEDIMTEPGTFALPRMMFISTSILTDVRVQVED